jgi:anti-anti-sigma regulatory factor
MEFKVEKNEQFALIELKETSLTQENSPDFEAIVRKLFREGYGNMIIDFNSIDELDGFGISVIRKANKICLNELGLLIIVTKNDEIIEQLDAAKIEDLTIMPTVQEAIDAVYLNELENDFQSDEDDEYDHGEYGDSGGGGEKESDY